MNRFDSKKQVRLPGLLFSIILFSLLIFLALGGISSISGAARRQATAAGSPRRVVAPTSPREGA